MSILDKVKIGNKVKVNLALSSDRLNEEVTEALKNSSIGTVKDFRITDGKGIGLILKLSNGKEQWFFENEIDILDESGKIIVKDSRTNESNSLIYQITKELKYENKRKVKDLINPFNFIIWLIISLKDIF